MSEGEKRKRFTKRELTKNQIATIVVFCLIVVILVFVLNPKLIFFINGEQQAGIQQMVDRNFGALSVTSETQYLTIGSFVSLVIMVAMILSISSMCRLLLRSIHFRNKKQETIKIMIINSTRYIAGLIIIVWGLAIFGVNMVAVFAGIGIVGMIIGFGAQSLIEDIFTGIFIVFEGQFSVGDIISIDGFRGKVLSIGIRTTSLVDTGGNVKIVSNSDIRNVHNLSAQTSYAISDVSIAYSASIEEAEKIIERALVELQKKYPTVFLDKPEYLGVQDLSSSSVDLRCWAEVDESQIYMARRLMNRELKLALDKGGIEIPFPQVVVHNAKD